MTTNDISILSSAGLGLSGYISSELLRAANQYVILLLTRSNTDCFREAFSPLSDLGSTNINPDLQAFKTAFDMSHSYAISELYEDFPNIIITLGNVIIEDNDIRVYIKIQNSETEEQTTITL